MDHGLTPITLTTLSPIDPASPLGTKPSAQVAYSPEVSVSDPNRQYGRIRHAHRVRRPASHRSGSTDKD
ncbi:MULTISPECIES: hypothetical protein [unclassified Lysobacter]|uniref:hypothetical protein n=1 Tax=unclassified Lysobacter TaxID=2635362 RepID=UPI001C21AD46|nr:hypothetical protein [Lysobacter sp. MMG2]MBU8976622.1 hypothetical protein [Lysobacter sp. MMG2]